MRLQDAINKSSKLDNTNTFATTGSFINNGWSVDINYRKNDDTETLRSFSLMLSDGVSLLVDAAKRMDEMAKKNPLLNKIDVINNGYQTALTAQRWFKVYNDVI